VAEDRRSGENLLEQDIFLEPFSDVIFAASEMVLITGEALNRTVMFQDGNDAIGVFRRIQGPLRYVVYSDLMSRSEKLAVPLEGSTPEAIQDRYLQLPELHSGIYELAGKVTAGYTGSIEKALAIERFLVENYGYSLDNRSASADDPLYDFLMENKTGHCEYFAAAQAIMMRIVGIPTRVVNGFRRGELNRFSDYFIVRQSDAHSWVEGYFPGPGWMEFDSTPVVNTGPQGFALTRWAAQLLDSVDSLWVEIIMFDRVAQIGVFRSLRANVSNTWNEISRISSHLDEFAKLQWLDGFKAWDLGGVASLMASGLLAAACWMIYRFRRYFRVLWKQLFSGKVSSSIAPEYYLEMLDLLRRKGLVKVPAETPREFVERIQADVSSPAPALITHLYYRNRFGHVPLGVTDLSRVYGWLKELRR
jgi:transglutaminase-like putative cysteine protease